MSPEIITGIFTLAGVIVGSVIGYFITIRVIKRQEFNKAAAELRSAFAPAIAKFNILDDTNTIKAMLDEELIPQSVAIEKFRPFIHPDKKDTYQEAWENYHQSHKREGVSSVYWLHYAMGDEVERFNLFKSRINEILKFTNQ